eukprot:12136875-Alexandrium_andersonii.AAC.1
MCIRDRHLQGAPARGGAAAELPRQDAAARAGVAEGGHHPLHGRALPAAGALAVPRRPYGELADADARPQGPRRGRALLRHQEGLLGGRPAAPDPPAHLRRAAGEHPMAASAMERPRERGGPQPDRPLRGQGARRAGALRGRGRARLLLRHVLAGRGGGALLPPWALGERAGGLHGPGDQSVGEALAIRAESLG